LNTNICSPNKTTNSILLLMSSTPSPSFDYHLTNSEQKSVEKLVPLHQAKIHIALRANLTINGTEYEHGACCLSEHLLVLAKKRFFGKSFSELKIVHLLDIVSMETSNDYTFTIFTEDAKIMIYTGEAMRLARNVIRDYHLSASIFISQRGFRFSPHDTKHFPPFKPKLSPSQQFQFTYNAYCSYYSTSYYHDVVRYYHKNLITGQGIIDLNQLPMNIIENNLKDPMDFLPFFNSIMHSPYVFGIVCNDICRPDLLASLSPMIGSSENLGLVSLKNCMIENGIEELSQALLKNPSCKINYWDLSGNSFEDCSPFMAALASVETPVFYLDFNDCNLSKQSVDILLKSLSINNNLWKLQYLHISGGIISDESANEFHKHYKNMSERGYLFLKSLDIGGASSGVERILETLVSYPQPLVTLKLPNSKLKSGAFSSLVSFLAASDKLEELDISGTSLSIEQILRLIFTITKNENLTSIKLWLGSLKLNGKKLIKILVALETFAPKKWSMLSFENNGLSAEDLSRIIHQCHKFKNLRCLRIGKNFSSSNKGIGDLLVKILDIKHLYMLSLVGEKKKGLRKELLPFLNALRHNKSLKSLDIRLNYCGDEGMEILTQVVKHSRSINELKYDGARPKSIKSIISFLEGLSESQSILSCALPRDDIYKALAKVKANEKDSVIKQLSDNQKNVVNTILRNMALFNIHSFLASKGIPALDELIDDQNVELVQTLHRTDLHTHSGISSLIGLPLPFVDSASENSDTNTVKSIDVPGSTEYDTPEMTKEITEHVDSNLSDLQTLQFNSLCIRRPGSVSIRQREEQDQLFTGSESSDSLESDDPPPSVMSTISSRIHQTQTSKLRPTFEMPTSIYSGSTRQ